MLSCSDGTSGGSASAVAAADATGSDVSFAQDASGFVDAITGKNADAEAASGGDASGDAGVVWSDAAPATAPATIGAIRPADVIVPKDWAAKADWPLIVLLHGYGATGALQDLYLGISQRADKFGFVTVIPNGTLDSSGKLFWNASDACCNFAKVAIDDVGYVTSLIDEAIAKLRVDPARVYLIGHSNGAFMALRMACEQADKITAIASLAGAANADAAKCQPTQAVSVLHIHGTLDPVIQFGGGSVGLSTYPSAAQTIALWRKLDGCNETAIEDPAADFEAALLGAETTRKHWSGCAQSTRADFWTINAGVHVPAFTSAFGDTLIAHLLNQKRTAK